MTTVFCTYTTTMEAITPVSADRLLAFNVGGEWFRATERVWRAIPYFDANIARWSEYLDDAHAWPCDRAAIDGATVYWCVHDRDPNGFRHILAWARDRLYTIPAQYAIEAAYFLGELATESAPDLPLCEAAHGRDVPVDEVASNATMRNDVRSMWSVTCDTETSPSRAITAYVLRWWGPSEQPYPHITYRNNGLGTYGLTPEHLHLYNVVASDPSAREWLQYHDARSNAELTMPASNHRVHTCLIPAWLIFRSSANPPELRCCRFTQIHVQITGAATLRPIALTRAWAAVIGPQPMGLPLARFVNRVDASWVAGEPAIPIAAARYAVGVPRADSATGEYTLAAPPSMDPVGVLQAIDAGVRVHDYVRVYRDHQLNPTVCPDGTLACVLLPP